MRILVIEDAEQLRRYVTKGLQNAGYAVDNAEDGEEGLRLTEGTHYDVIILDLMLPKMDGMSLLHQLRNRGNKTHVLILTAKTTVDDRVFGLQQGADDYLIKPFALEELLARVQALIRRKYDVKTHQIHIGELIVDTVGRRASLKGHPLNLRPREYALLEYLALRKGQVISRLEIETHVYGSTQDVYSNAIDSSVCILRKKLSNFDEMSYIQTLHRQGYILEASTNEK